MLPTANTAMMNLHLLEIGTAVSSGAHAVLVVDGAGWHQTGGSLRVPDNITLLHLPSPSPELDPVENVWAFLRGNKLSNLVFAPTTPSPRRAAMPGTGSHSSQTASHP